MGYSLIVEDEPMISFVFQELLEKEGYQSMNIDDGEKALHHLQTKETPDLILLDLFIPKKSGKEILEVLQADSKLRDIPVIVISGAVVSEDILPPPTSYQKYIAKPFDIVDVVTSVRELLE